MVTLHNTVDLPRDLSDPNSEKAGRTCSDWPWATTAATPGCASLPGPRRSISHPSAPIGAGRRARRAVAGAADSVRLAHGHRQAALSGPALSCEHGVGNWGWAIIIVTVIFNLLHAAHALHDDEVFVEDDAHSAQGGGAQEAVRPSEDDRPQKGGDERRDDGSVQDREREHVRQLPADAHPDAAVLRLLPRAAKHGRAAPGPLVLADHLSSPTRCTFCPSSSSSACFSRSTSRLLRAWTRPSGA